MADCIPVPDQYLNNPDDICGDLDETPFECRQVKKFEDFIKEKSAQKISETYIREEPARNETPKSERIQQIEG